MILLSGATLLYTVGRSVVRAEVLKSLRVLLARPPPNLRAEPLFARGPSCDRRILARVPLPASRERPHEGRTCVGESTIPPAQAHMRTTAATHSRSALRERPPWIKGSHGARSLSRACNIWLSAPSRHPRLPRSACCWCFFFIVPLLISEQHMMAYTS